jgi:hypothetical protein
MIEEDMRKLIVLLALSIGMALPALASADFQGWGPRVGVTVNPDQIHFGAHADFGPMAQHVRFQPSMEMGLGDNLTVLALNGDLAYRFSSRWDAWTPYLGGGASVFFVGDDNGLMDGTNTEAGLAALGGIEKGMSSGSRFFLEGKVGFLDAPDFKVTAGWSFAH